MKKKLPIIAIVVLGVLCAAALLPKTRSINVQTTAYEYALNQKEPIAAHEISIGGRYTKRLFREDVFSGHMLISGFPETNGASVYIQFWNDHDFGVISYQQGGIPVWDTELEQMYVNKDFSKFAIQLFEVAQDGENIQSQWNGETGRILCPAPDYETMTKICAELGLPISVEGGEIA